MLEFVVFKTTQQGAESHQSGALARKTRGTKRIVRLGAVLSIATIKYSQNASHIDVMHFANRLIRKQFLLRFRI